MCCLRFLCGFIRIAKSAKKSELLYYNDEKSGVDVLVMGVIRINLRMGIMAGKINDKKASTELTAEANILGYISMFTFSRVRNPER